MNNKIRNKKEISIEQLRSINNKPEYKTILWHGIAVTIRTLLPLNEVPLFINSVMDSCYDKTHNAFAPEMKDFAFRVNTVMRYACVDLPKDINEQYSILYNTDIFDIIHDAINHAQIDSIQQAIDSLLLH